MNRCEKMSGGNGRDMVAWRPCIWRFAAGYRRAGDFTWSARNWRGGQQAQKNARENARKRMRAIISAERAAGSREMDGI